jgi:hypothetical protein
VASIEITAAEEGEKGTWTSFEAVDASLHARIEQHGCKVNFTVTWVDGRTYAGRIDLLAEDRFRSALLGRQIVYYAETITLRRLIPGYSREEQERLLKVMHVTEEDQAILGDILDRYDLGPKTPAEQKAAEDAAAARWKVEETNRAAAESRAALEATWWTGDRYDSTMTVGEASRAVRADLTALARSTPSVLFGASFKVRSSGRAIYVYVTQPAGASVVNLERARAVAADPHGHHTLPHWTELGDALLAAASAAADRYNYDRSDRGRGHDHVVEAFMLSVEFTAGVKGAVYEAEAARALLAQEG